MRNIKLPSASAAFPAVPVGCGALATMPRFWQRECNEQSEIQSRTIPEGDVLWLFHYQSLVDFYL
jgi:hypothetical protein